MRRFFRDIAQGTHCLSVGALALGLSLGSLVPPMSTPASVEPPAAPAQAAVQATQPAPSPLNLLDTHDIPPGPYGKLIFEVASRYSLNPHLVAAVVRVESSFNPRALSRKGACGLMQLLPETAQRFGLRRKDLFDPAKNLDAGARYLRWLANRFGHDPVRVLAAYNAGEGAVQRYGGVPPFKETRRYVDRIFSLLGLNEEAKVLPAASAPEVVLAR
jgi:soluble lytic murein transglycosylase-like protein